MAKSSFPVSIRAKSDRYIGMFDRALCNAAQSIDFIKQVDTLMDEGQVLKNDDSCYVSHIVWNDRHIVIKRYNHRGFIHSLRHTVKKSRARRGWWNANLLAKLHIATPAPLAYIEHRKGFLLWKSYLVTSYIKGQRLQNFLSDDNVTEEKRALVTQQAMTLLDKMGKCRITHGDLKHKNILVTDDGPVLADLDAMIAHKSVLTYWWRRHKDLTRFAKQEK
jgi:tRNA A-37 threonylcarbamoyl transferase component Bud32